MACYVYRTKPFPDITLGLNEPSLQATFQGGGSPCKTLRYCPSGTRTLRNYSTEKKITTQFFSGGEDNTFTLSVYSLLRRESTTGHILVRWTKLNTNKLHPTHDSDRMFCSTYDAEHEHACTPHHLLKEDFVRCSKPKNTKML